MNRTRLSRWLDGLPLSGWLAVVCAISALAMATAVRAAVDGLVRGCEFTPYLPFVLICALFLRWWQAALVALASVAVLGGTFVGLSHLGSTCFMSGTAIFLGSSAVIIAVATFGRDIISAVQGVRESRDGIVFSLDKGEVWASWYGQGLPIRLGNQRRVAEMMEDFLAQVEVGKRLTGR